MLLIAVFSLLSILHIYWSVGGKWGFEQSLPQKPDGGFLFRPRKAESLIVGLFLLSFSLYYWIKTGLLPILDFPKWIMDFGGVAIAVIFLLRVIGDFNYVGIFKKVKDTDFAKRDTKYFVPLCLIISILTATIEWLLD